MIAEELINQMIPALKVTDKAEKAIIWMEELKTNQLPVIQGRTFKGLISEDIILEKNDLDTKIGEFPLIGENCFVFESEHLFDIIRMSQEYSSELVAVVDEHKEFLGVSSYEDTLKAFSSTLTVQGRGGIIVISLLHIDYSLAQISRIIESEDVKILGSFVNPHPTDPGKLYLTLKLNKEDLSGISSALTRFGYSIVAKFHQVKKDEREKERLDNLLKFLDI